MVFADFINFIEGMNLTNMIVSMIISRSLFDLVKTLIKQFLTPVITKLFIKDEIADIEFKYFGKEVDLGEIVDHTIMFVISMIIAYLIYKFITPII